MINAFYLITGCPLQAFADVYPTIAIKQSSFKDTRCGKDPEQPLDAIVRECIISGYVPLINRLLDGSLHPMAWTRPSWAVYKNPDLVIHAQGRPSDNPSPWPTLL